MPRKIIDTLRNCENCEIEFFGHTRFCSLSCKGKYLAKRSLEVRKELGVSIGAKVGRKNKNALGNWKCEICEEVFRTRRELQDHKKVHGTSIERNKEKLKKEYTCQYCGRLKITTKEGATNHERVCKENPNRQKTSQEGKSLTVEHKQNVSRGMKKAHEEGRAWNIGKSRWNNEPSYPEKWFMQVIENEFNDKLYEREYSCSIYSIDFAWVHKMKGIEIDGSQHQRFKEYQERDERKMKKCTEFGWKILRISWKECFNNPKQWIKIAKEFIEN